MKLTLDGFSPTDKKAAYKTGTTKTYVIPAPYGPDGKAGYLTATFKHAGPGNGDFAAAAAHALEVATADDREVTANERFACIWDHCIIALETNIQSGGQDLQVNIAETFIALMNVDADELQAVFAQMMSDIYSRQTFTEAELAKTAGN